MRIFLTGFLESIGDDARISQKFYKILYENILTPCRAVNLPQGSRGSHQGFINFL